MGTKKFSIITVAILATLALGIGTASADVINGNFSSGTTGFTSGYLYFAQPGSPAGGYTNPKSSLYDEGTYGVGTDPGAYHISWAHFGDHTTGSGNMMIVNGNISGGTAFWTETISVSENTNYVFSLWAASVYPSGAAAIAPATLRISLDGNAPIFFNLSTTNTVGTWEQFSTMWNSGAGTTAVLSLYDTNLTVSGNDFALDDISNTAVPEPTTMLLLGLGLLGMAGVRRFSK